MELHWQNKNKSLLIDYDNDFAIQWVPKSSSLVKEIREILPYNEKIVNTKFLAYKVNLLLGDNLFGLNALIKEFENIPDNKKVKFVYIDPPYNTFNPDLLFKDNLDHDEWLSFMQDRLERVKQILKPDGVVCVQIDDREYARMYLLMVELFGEKNLKTIVVKMSEPSGLKMKTAKLGGIPKLKEYLILAKLDGILGFHFESIPKTKWDPEYNLFIKNFSFEESERIRELQEKETILNKDIEEIDKICSKFELVTVNSVVEEENLESDQSKMNFFNENSWRICRTASSSSIFQLTEEKKSTLVKPQQIFSVVSKRGILYLVKSDYTADARKPRVQILFAQNHMNIPLGDLWTDIKTTGLEFEGNIDFKNGKKPEKLLRRLIEGITDENDLILDLFCGSGTTCAVALGLKRKSIGLEVDKEIYKLAITRLEKKNSSLQSQKDGAGTVGYFKLQESINK